MEGGGVSFDADPVSTQWRVGRKILPSNGGLCGPPTTTTSLPIQCSSYSSLYFSLNRGRQSFEDFGGPLIASPTFPSLFPSLFSLLFNFLLTSILFLMPKPCWSTANIIGHILNRSVRNDSTSITKKFSISKKDLNKNKV